MIEMNDADGALGAGRAGANGAIGSGAGCDAAIRPHLSERAGSQNMRIVDEVVADTISSAVTDPGYVKAFGTEGRTRHPRRTRSPRGRGRH
jgi:hypothetical protein